MQHKINFSLFRGSGGQIKFLIEKKDGEAYWYRRSRPGKDIGSACLLYMGVRLIRLAECFFLKICLVPANFHANLSPKLKLHIIVNDGFYPKKIVSSREGCLSPSSAIGPAGPHTQPGKQVKLKIVE